MGDDADKTPRTPPSTEVLDISYETVVLALDLVGKEVPDIPGRLIQALQGVSLQKEITDFLNDYSKKLLQQYNTSKPLNSTDAGKLALKSLQSQGQKVGQEVLKDLAEQVKGTQEFENLKEQLKKLGKEFTDQPIGVWFTDTKAYIIATGVLVSGGAIVFATYYGAKKMGLPTVLSALEGQSIKMKTFGSVDLSTQIAKVDKTAGVVDFKVSGTKDWKPLKLTIEVIGHASLKDLTRVEGAGANAKLAIQVSKNVQLEAKAGIDKPVFNHRSIVADLEAVLKIKPDEKQPFSVNVGVSFKDTGKRPEGAFTLGVEIPIGSEHSKYDSLVQKGLDRP